MPTVFDRASFYYDSCSSTNDIAQAYLLKRRVAEGTVFIADYQYRGKGQRGKTWTSQHAQNLLFSLILYPGWLAIEHFFSLNIITSLAIYDVLLHKLPEGISIKWPNDIYYLDQKLGGVLIETSIGHMEKIKTVIIGIGLNVNQLHFEWPKATSLALHKGAVFDRSLLLTQIIDTLGRYYGQLQSGMVDLIWTSYLHKLYRRIGFHFFKTINGYMEGRIVEVNRWGQLVIEKRNGSKYSYDVKEIVFI
ncbi:biotin--[acetyl-CoA-carboxylase] ligase [Candidatus Cardinium hertigii]|jgi:BirA family biotin operon repressor/biotin-[acetyl-CoA-carboxylase] ligase|uniref:Biotin--[acetyl-CoA-carboxylase] ligase n=1 Tax=Candidatus Cardinium hertigii TaxID=247481 RepID=A0A3N2QCX7_9BACT|nr:biotin--[acetyl-CoA-carboxylase] ligase [Candidatus Cardinium hertigii]ROT47674.1 biotin--[acetyl-CoA-carboxylase] ligase [Candidatus Cardinium hertigii]ROT47675.1 biotin--[acetyl-CoA-carboxylase] ligase [Candidatus Cardinium hertigii]